MSLVRLGGGLVCVAALVAASGCSSDSGSQTNGDAGTSSNGGNDSGGSTSNGGQVGAMGGTSNAGTGGTSTGGTSTAGTGGTSSAGTGGTSVGGSGGNEAAGAGGTGVAGTGGGDTGGAGGTAGTSQGGGSSNPAYAPDPRPINVTGTDHFAESFNGQDLFLDHSKPAQGKLVLFLGGIGGGPGGGGIEAFVHKFGFHCFSPRTDTNLTGSSVPQMYKDAASDPTNTEANRQEGDALLELWDGIDRVDWYTHNGQDMQSETIAAIHQAEVDDPAGDWGFFLDDAGKLRTGDVWVVGYSWGSQTWAMISAYIPFGRVITTSGPQDDGFPNAGWILHPSPDGTPGDRKYLLVGLKNPYEMMATEDNHELGMITTVLHAGWVPGVTDVTLTSPGPYMASQHLFAMIGGDGGTSPGGHTVFCNDNPANQWIPLCNYVFGVQ